MLFSQSRFGLFFVFIALVSSCKFFPVVYHPAAQDFSFTSTNTITENFELKDGQILRFEICRPMEKSPSYDEFGLPADPSEKWDCTNFIDSRVQPDVRIYQSQLSIRAAADARFLIFAFLDKNSNGIRDAGEPYGIDPGKLFEMGKDRQRNGTITIDRE